MPERCQDISTSLHTFWHKVPTDSSYEYLQSWFVCNTLRPVLFWMQKKKKGRFSETWLQMYSTTRANPPGLFCGCKRWLLKVGWTFSLQGTDGYIHFLSVLVTLFVTKWRGLRSEPPPCVSPAEARNTILCLHELFLKCCVFNLMLRVTNYLKQEPFLFVECASTLFKCELCDFSMTTVWNVRRISE